MNVLNLIAMIVGYLVLGGLSITTLAYLYCQLHLKLAGKRSSIDGFDPDPECPPPEDFV